MFASLYLGTGTLETELVGTIETNVAFVTKIWQDNDFE